MLTKILSVSGKPGLYKLISTGKNLNIVESLADGKRIPVYMTEKVVALSDVSIYTDEGDVPLKDVLAKIKEKENSKAVALDNKTQNNDFFSYFAVILPEYDRERVYASDIRKLMSWYNILVEHNIDFESVEKKETDDTAEETPKAEVKEKKPEPKQKKTSTGGAKADTKAKKAETHSRTKH